MTLELARVIDRDDEGCTLAFTRDARVERAMFAVDILRYAIPIRPGERH